MAIDLQRLAAMGYLTPDAPRSQISDEFRIIKRPLLTNVNGKSAAPVERANLIMVTSSLPGEGKTFVAVNLAISIAMEMDKTVLLVDADVSRPSVLSRLGLAPSPGLLDVLMDSGMQLSDVLLRTNIDTLSLLPAGTPRGHATEMLASDSMAELLDQMASRYADRLIVFDAPPLLPSTESRVLATHMGQVIVVVEAEHTSQKSVEQALATLESCPVVMPMLNKASRSESARTMAITDRPKRKMLGQDRSEPQGARRRSRRAVALAAAAALAPLGAHAQRWTVDTGIGSELVWSSNPELGVADGRDDTTLNVRPHIAIRAEGGRFRLGGSAALNAITSANGTQPSRVLPEADLNGRLEAVERLVFIDAGLRAQQTSLNPFGARPEQATTRNTLTAASASLSPSLEKDFSDRTRLRLRSNNSWTRESGSSDAPAASSAEGYFARHSFLAEHDARPFGWRLEAERSLTEYRNEVEPSLKLDLVRASGLYQVDADLTVGVRMGRERTSLLPDDPNHAIYGLEARWQPSPRTTLDAFEEERFFGKSWRIGLNHRTPRVALNAVVSRALDTTPQSLFELPAFNNVATLLDTALLTRFPDPIERGRLVQDIIARQGLPAQTLSPLTLFLRRISLVTTRQVSVALLGIRNTLTLTAFQTRTEDATQSDPLLVDQAFANNTQQGASAALSHRLSQTVALNVAADWSRIRALQSSDRSVERTVRVRANAQLAPRTTVFAGARYRELASNIATEGREGAVFAGFDHQF